MDDIRSIEAARDQVLEELRKIRSLRRGTINEQFFTDKRGDEPVRRGPYYVLSRREGGKTVSRRLKPGEDLEQARTDIAEHKRFGELCARLEQLTEKLGEKTRQEQGDEKKRRQPSKKTKS